MGSVNIEIVQTVAIQVEGISRRRLPVGWLKRVEDERRRMMMMLVEDKTQQLSELGRVIRAAVH